jgi:hypothetical protein
MSSWLPALNPVHIPTMTNADPSTMEDEEPANRNDDSPEYIRDKYDMFSSEANLLNAHLQENAGLVPVLPHSPPPKAAYNTNPVTVSYTL